MDLSLHVIQPFQPVPPAADRRRRDRNAPAFELKLEAGPEQSAPERRDQDQKPHAAVHEEGVGESIDVVA